MPRIPITNRNPYTPRGGSLAGRTFYSERQYRNALARRKGFDSWNAQQRAPRRVRNAADLAALSDAERLANRQAFEALDLMRDGLPLSRAARRVGTTPNAVRRHVGGALERGPAGRWRAKTGDRLYRRLQVLGPDGPEMVDLRGSGAASGIGQYWVAVQHYLRTGDASRLRKFRGKSVAGVPFETDLSAIDEWARRGELSLEDIYELAA